MLSAIQLVAFFTTRRLQIKTSQKSVEAKNNIESDKNGAERPLKGNKDVNISNTQLAPETKDKEHLDSER